MSTQQDPGVPSSTTKKFGKGEREIPHHTQKAKKYYPAEDESSPKRVSPVLSTGSNYGNDTFDGIPIANRIRQRSMGRASTQDKD